MPFPAFRTVFSTPIMEERWQPALGWDGSKVQLMLGSWATEKRVDRAEANEGYMVANGANCATQFASWAVRLQGNPIRRASRPETRASGTWR